MVNAWGVLLALFCCAFAYADAFIAEFGTTDGDRVDGGYVLVDGKYLQPPYRVSRRGLQLFVNDQLIGNPTRHPGDKPLIGDADPNHLPEDELQRLLRRLEGTRAIYEDYLEKGYCYLFSSRGGHQRLDPYSAAYKLPQVIELLLSTKPRNEKIAELVRRNWHLAIDVEFLVDQFSGPPPQLMMRLSENAEELLRVDVFGSAESSIDKGFVFVNGKYLEAPYVLRRRGLGLFIGNKMIERPMKWPVEIPSGDEDPVLPSEIDEETSIYDPIVSDYLGMKVAYLTKNYTREEEARVMEEVLRSLPFVTEARLDEDRPHILHITTTEGEVIPTSLVAFRGRRVGYDQQSVLQRIEAKRQHLENALTKGDACFFFGEGGRARPPADTLPLMLEVLQSGKSLEQKTSELHQLCPAFSEDWIRRMASDFVASPELEARVNRLVQSSDQ